MAGHPHKSTSLRSCSVNDDDGIVVECPSPTSFVVLDDTLYVGHTDDLASREETHNDGKRSEVHRDAEARAHRLRRRTCLDSEVRLHANIN